MTTYPSKIIIFGIFAIIGLMVGLVVSPSETITKRSIFVYETAPGLYTPGINTKISLDDLKYQITY